MRISLRMMAGLLTCLLTVCLAAAPTLAKQAGGLPPGQAKKLGHGEAGGPPPWAPAHGYRAKHQYRYWPGSQVYFDPTRGVYFWARQGHWRQGPQLPPKIRLLGAAVELFMETATPYDWHTEVIRRYPGKP